MEVLRNYESETYFCKNYYFIFYVYLLIIILIHYYFNISLLEYFKILIIFMARGAHTHTKLSTILLLRGFLPISMDSRTISRALLPQLLSHPSELSLTSLIHLKPPRSPPTRWVGEFSDSRTTTIFNKHLEHPGPSRVGGCCHCSSSLQQFFSVNLALPTLVRTCTILFRYVFLFLA